MEPGRCGLQQLWPGGSVVAVSISQASSCGRMGFMLCGVCDLSLDRDQTYVLLLWQADSLPLNHQGSPFLLFRVLLYVSQVASDKEFASHCLLSPVETQEMRLLPG